VNRIHFHLTFVTQTKQLSAVFFVLFVLNNTILKPLIKTGRLIEDIFRPIK